MAITNGQVLTCPVHLTQRSKARKHLRTRIDEISLCCVEAILQIPDEDIVVLVEGVIDAHHVMWTGELGRRIPAETGEIQAVSRVATGARGAQTAEGIWQRKTIDDAGYSRISSDSLRIIACAEDVKAVDTVPEAVG